MPPSQPGGQKAGEKEKSVGVRRVHPSGGKSGEGRAGNPAGPTLPVFSLLPTPALPMLSISPHHSGAGGEAGKRAGQELVAQARRKRRSVVGPMMLGKGLRPNARAEVT